VPYTQWLNYILCKDKLIKVKEKYIHNGLSIVIKLRIEEDAIE
jgi:hypothetical protein